MMLLFWFGFFLTVNHITALERYVFSKYSFVEIEKEVPEAEEKSLHCPEKIGVTVS